MHGGGASFCEFPLLHARFWAGAASPAAPGVPAAGEAAALSGAPPPPADTPPAAPSMPPLGPPPATVPGAAGTLAALNLADISRDDAPPSELQVRREKFNFFEKHCSHVGENVYVGSDAVARNRATLAEHGITHVVNCVGFVCPNYFDDELDYLTFWLQDTPGEDITAVLHIAMDYIDAALAVGGRVLVHCSQGVSRSASIAIAYLMWKRGTQYDVTYRAAKAARGIVNPNMGFACQLLNWQKRRVAPPEPGAARLYRIAPHSCHDPRRLVPKALPAPRADAVDERFAFVLHAPDNVAYTWVGPRAPPEFGRAAAEFARHLCRFEGAAAARDVPAGGEPPEFLAAIGVEDAGVRTWEGAARKLYDEDCELFESGLRSEVAQRGGAGAQELARPMPNAGVLKRPSVQRTLSGEPYELNNVSGGGAFTRDFEQSGFPSRSVSALIGPPRVDRSADAPPPTARGGGGGAPPQTPRGGAPPLFKAPPVVHAAPVPVPVPAAAPPPPAARSVSLFEYPEMEDIGVFDMDDLDPEKVFIMRVSGGGAATELFVWFGGETEEAEDGETSEAADRIVGEVAETLGLPELASVKVFAELERDESEEFWERFESV